MDSTHRHIAIALATVGLGACGSASTDPSRELASRHVAASAMTATTIGQAIDIDATVLNANGEPIANAEIHWELSEAGILEMVGNGHFRVLREGSVRVAAVWPKDPSVRAAVSIKVDASALFSACVSRSDQATSAQSRKCAQQRVVVMAAPSSPTLAVAPEGVSRSVRGRP
jgi:hypothetical protein